MTKIFLKAISSVITSLFAFIGAIVTAWVTLTSTMDAKDAAAMTTIRNEMFSMREERNAKIEGLEKSIISRFDGQQKQLNYIGSQLTILVSRGPNEK